jgi:O-antigen/teichoic acid export membrane protein
MERADDRHETPTERLDRNWTDLLQELRVVQTGVQFLTGFLLTLPFQQRFTELSQLQHRVYLGTVAASIVSTVLLQAPISVHRTLFRRHERAQEVGSAHQLAIAGMFFLAVAMVGVSYLVFSVVSGTGPAVLASTVAVLLILALWVVYPRLLRRAHRHLPPPT